MKIKVSFLLLIFLRTVPVFAFRSDTVKLFYAINESELSAENKLKLKAVNNSVSNFDSIYVTGYADYLAGREYNLALSQKRAETIKDYLHSFQKDLNITTSGKGAIARSSKISGTGEPMNRRVDIIVIRQKRGSAITRTADQGRYKPLSKPVSPPDYKPFLNKINTLSAVKIGASVSLEELTFQGGRHYLNPEAVPYLDKLVQYFKEHDNLSFEIIGHICCDIEQRDGFDQDTRTNRLSLNRARFVFEYLLNNGIARERMSYTGVGSSKPKITPEITPEDQYQNRRVEILITDK